MRGIWVALTLLIAAAGGAASGYYANLQYGPRTSLYPLRVGSAQSDFRVTVRRITYVKAAPERPEVRMSTPGIVDITPPEALAQLGIAPKPSLASVADNEQP